MKSVMAAALFAAAITGQAVAAHWTVQPASKLGFSVVWSGEPLNGHFGKWKADIEFDPADLARSRVTATIQTGSVATEYPEGDDGLKGALGFAVDRFPTAKFEAAAFRRQPDGSFVADGKLTIRGITRPVKLPFKLSIQGDRARVTGRTTVIRTDFGVGQGEWSDSKPVAHEVTVTLDLTAVRR